MNYSVDWDGKGERDREHPWEQNEHGLWCPACGEHIAAPWNMDDNYTPPENCKTCGFPDFENGPGYFTDGDV